MILISVIIPHFKQEESLIKCIQALENQSISKDLYEILVIHNENNIPDYFIRSLEFAKNVVILAEGKQGSYAARNTGIKHAKGKYLVFTDSDCIPDQKWLEYLYKVLSTESKTTRVSGQLAIIPPQKKKMDWCYQFETIFEFRQGRSARKGFAVTANMAVPKIVFDQVGYFDENLKSGGDKMWNLKAKAAGIPIFYEHRALVWHPSRNSLKDICNKYRRTYGGWFVIYGWHQSSLFLKLIYVLYPLRPPIRPVIELLQARPNLSKFLKVFTILIIIRFARVYEHLRLTMGGEPLR